MGRPIRPKSTGGMHRVPQWVEDRRPPSAYELVDPSCPPDEALTSVASLKWHRRRVLVVLVNECAFVIASFASPPGYVGAAMMSSLASIFISATVKEEGDRQC
jgi:hypothetical protein